MRPSTASTNNQLLLKDYPCSFVSLGANPRCIAFSVLSGAPHKLPQDQLFREFIPWFRRVGVVVFPFRPESNGFVLLGSVLHHVLNQTTRSFPISRCPVLGSSLKCVEWRPVFVWVGYLEKLSLNMLTGYLAKPPIGVTNS